MFKASFLDLAFWVLLFRRIPIFLVIVMVPALSLAVSSSSQVASSQWGGKGIHMVVQETGVAFEFDCAFGAIAHPLIVDSQGTFSTSGTYSIEPGGPGQDGEPALRVFPVKYSGSTDHSHMELRITFQESGRVIGPFSLQVNRKANLEKCY